MRNNGLRKYYFEKKLKQKEAQYCSNKELNYNNSIKNIQSNIKNNCSKIQRNSTKSNLLFNVEKKRFHYKNFLFSKENKENFNINENTYESKESKDTQENSINKNVSKNYYRHSRNYFKLNNFRNNKFDGFHSRLSTPMINENIYNSKIGEEIKNENFYKNNYGFTFDSEIEDLIYTTTSRIENEKEQKMKEEYEFKKYFEKVKKEKLSKNNFTKGSLAIIQMQMANAKEAIMNNKYISFVNLDNKENENNHNNICFRLGTNNMCVCGHTFSKHDIIKSNGEFKSNCKKCECEIFRYIPVFPEETNEYTKAYLLDFKYEKWKARCKCGHNWTKHKFNNREKCEECNCLHFESDFLCGICGSPWEKHITLFETKEDREKFGQTIGKDYEPFTKEQLENLFN